MLASPFSSVPKPQLGFTLIEIIVGIVVLAIALVVITGVLGPLYKKSADPWHQVRAAELGHSFLNEIMARSFDENSDRAGAEYRCDANPAIEIGAISCTASILFGADGSTETNLANGRLAFDDVDDFHNYRSDGSAVTNIVAGALADSYLNYQIAVSVGYDGNMNGILNEDDTAGSDERRAKVIRVDITTPTGEVIRFSSYKGNW